MGREREERDGGGIVLIICFHYREVTSYGTSASLLSRAFSMLIRLTADLMEVLSLDGPHPPFVLHSQPTDHKEVMETCTCTCILIQLYLVHCRLVWYMYMYMYTTNTATVSLVCIVYCTCNIAVIDDITCI